MTGKLQAKRCADEAEENEASADLVLHRIAVDHAAAASDAEKCLEENGEPSSAPYIGIMIAVDHAAAAAAADAELNPQENEKPSSAEYIGV